ncbi:MAG TPA: heme-binding protein, partial [Casimicrobiaceae bacterium]|nr:heme-binding protein [Casimicrobiaceae bacterium]
MLLRAFKLLLGTMAVVLGMASLAPESLAADPQKVLHVAFEVAETGFDPVRVTDNYSSMVMQVVFERLLSYDYLA